MNKVLIILLFIPSVVFSYQWPSNKDNIDVLFGSVKDSVVLDGIEFKGSDQAVYPLTDGDILFYQDSFQFGDAEYKGAEGNVLILSHKGEFRSNYRNFTPTDGFNEDDKILHSDMVGVTGSKGDGFVFSIYDEKKDEYINPQQLLPLIEDDLSPVISKVYISNSGSFSQITKNKKVSSGNSKLYIDAYDLIKINNKFKKFNPFSIFVFIDGFERFHVTFSSIKEIDSKLYFSGVENISINNFIDNKGFLYGGDVYLTRGKSLIEIVIKDSNGNEASRSYPVLIE